MGLIANDIYKGSEDVYKMYEGDSLIYEKASNGIMDYFYIYADGHGVNEGETVEKVAEVSFLHDSSSNSYTPNLEYSRDFGNTWVTWDYSTLDLYGPEEMTEGSPHYDYIFFRGLNNVKFNGHEGIIYVSYNKFNIKDITADSKAYIYIGGNIMSLLYGDNFRDKYSLPVRNTGDDDIFNGLFDKCDIFSAAELKLPATVLTRFCYCNMFGSCSHMEYAPKVLPANNLASFCYAGMFGGCTSLTTAPDLPAQNLANGCYSVMFRDCTSLTEAPVLPAKNIPWEYPEMSTNYQGDYRQMFENCTSLNLVKIYAENIEGLSLHNWLNNVNPQGTLIKKRSLDFDFTYYVPEGWTVEEID